MKKNSWFWRNLDYLVVISIALVFFIATSYYITAVQDSSYVKFLSPDETANYFFAKQYAQRGEVAVFEKANLISEEIVHPRSIRSDNGWLKPVSFLGIILVYGQIGSYFGVAVIPYLTPFFASLGILFFYTFTRKLFGKKVALVSSVMLASFPVYFFYTVRSMFHNVLFVVFLIGMATCLLDVLPKKDNGHRSFWEWRFSRQEWLSYLYSFLSGIFLGLAVGARSSELLWLAPSLFLLWIFYAKRLGLSRLLIALSAFFLALLPIFYWNQILYSSPFYGGYGEMNRSISEISKAGGDIFRSTVSANLSDYSQSGQIIFKNIFYFGYQPYQSLRMFYYYVFRMFPVLCVFCFLGIILFFRRLFNRPKKAAFIYLSVWLLLSVILVFYYGSWKFNDNPDPSRFTIGNSYTRYWLPMYILALPFAALAVSNFAAFMGKLAGKFLEKKVFLLISLVIVGLWSFLSLSFVFFGSEEGLATLYHNHFLDKESAFAIIASTERESIVVTRYHDKQLFPERKVVNSLLTDEAVNYSLEKLLDFYPVYYYNFAFPEKDLEYLNSKRLPLFGFKIKMISRHGRFGLYRLEKIGTISN